MAFLFFIGKIFIQKSPGNFEKKYITQWAKGQSALNFIYKKGMNLAK